MEIYPLGKLTLIPLPARLNEAAAATANGYVYVLGGQVDGANHRNTVYYAKANPDGSLGSFTTTTSLPASLWSATAEVANGYLYVIGGCGSACPVSTIYYSKINPDGTLGTWSTGSISTGVRNEHSSVIANGYLYVIGGFNGPTNTVSYAKLNADGSIGSFSSTSTIPASLARHSSVVANGYLYVIGGDNGSAVSTVYYAKLNADGSVGAWSTNSNSLPDIRENHTSVVANGYLYVIGGATQCCGGSQSTVYFARLNGDGSVGVFSTALNSLPSTTNQGVSVVINGYIYTMGGWSGASTINAVYYASLPRVSIAADLDLLGLTTKGAISDSAGNVGGAIYAGNIFSNNNLEVTGNSTFWGGAGFFGPVSIGVGATSPSSPIFNIFNSSGPQVLSVFSGGNVGIGTTSSAANLSVSGNGLFGWGSASSFAGPSNGLAVSGNVGIGITTANSALTVNGGVSIGSSYNFTAPANGLIVQGNVGIGTTTPYAKLNLRGTSTGTGLNFLTTDNTNNTFGLAVLDNGNLGIGTTSPSQVFQVNTGSSASVFTSGGNLGIGTTSPSQVFQVNYSSTNPVVITSGGNVGIGSTTPTSALQVIGTITGQNLTNTSTVVLGVSSTNLTASRIDLAPVNLVKNASFESWSGGTGTTSSVPDGWVRDCSGSGIVTTSTTEATDGTYAVDVQSTCGSNTGLYQTLPTLIAGRNYVVSFRGRVSVSGGDGRVSITDSSNNVLANMVMTGSGSSTTSLRSFTFTPGSNLTSGRLRITRQSGGTSVYVDAVTLTEGTVGADFALTPITDTGNQTIYGNLTLQNASSGYGISLNTNGNSYIWGNGNLGIGTTSSSAGMSVAGNSVIGYGGTSSFSAPSNGLAVSGNVGIGTTTASANLTVVGTTSISGVATLSAGNGALSFTGSTPSLTSGSSVFGLFAGGNVGIGTTATLGSSFNVNGNQIIGSSFIGGAAPANGLAVQGNVGIGTTGPTQTLDVNGTTVLRGNVTFGTDNTYDIGPGNLRPRDLYLARILSFAQTGSTVTSERQAVTFSTASNLIVNGSYTDQRYWNLGTPTVLVNTGNTLTNAYTMYIGGAPSNSGAGGQTGVITNSYGLRIVGSPVNVSSGLVTNAFGLSVDAPTGATNNYAAVFSGGNVGIGTTAPATLFEVSGRARVNSLQIIGDGSTAKIGTTGSSVFQLYSDANFSNAANLNVGAASVGFSYGLTLPSNGLAVSGNVGIGITTANSNLSVIGNGTFGADFGKATAPANGLLVQGNVGIGFTTPSASLSVNSQSITTGNLTSISTLSSNTLTTGTLLSVASTATSLTGTAGTGSLLNLSWAPPSSTTATGDLFALSIGANGTTTGNLFNILDSGSSIFSVSESSFTTSLPANFTSSGDVSMAYDLNFTNPTASYIKSAAPLILQAGETFNSSNLTLRTFNSGQGVFDFAGGVTLNQVQNWTLASGINSLNFQDLSNNSILNIDSTNDRVGIGYSAPYAKFQVKGAGSGTGISFLTTDSSNTQRFAILDNGNVGIGTTGPTGAFQVNAGTGIGTGAFFVTSAGNVGIGTSTPLGTLQIASGQILLPGGSNFNNAPSLSFSNTTNTGLYSDGNGSIVFATSGNRPVNLSGSHLKLSSDQGLEWTNATANATGNSDLILVRDAAGTLAQINGTNAQDFRVYNTYTSGTNYELGNFGWNSNILTIGTEKGSAGGSTRALALETGGATRLTIDTNGNVGIGTTSPSQIFQVNTNTSNPFVVTSGGNVGIGVTTANNRLVIASDINITPTNASLIGTAGGAQLAITGDSGTGGTEKKLVLGIDTTDNYGVIQAGNTSGTNYNLSLNPAGGNVGIGTTTPVYNFQLVTSSGAAGVFGIFAGNAAPKAPASGDVAVFQNANGGANVHIVSNTASQSVLYLGSVTTSTLGRIIYDNPSNNLSLWTNSNQRLSIDSSGNVGIGVTGGGAKLQINGNEVIGFGTSTSAIAGPTSGLAVSGNVGIGTTTANSTLSVSGNTHIGSLRQGISAPTDGLFVDGNVGIGATTSSNLLDVWGNARITGTLTVDGILTGPTTGSIGYFSRTNNPVALVYPTTITDTIGTYGNLGVGTTAPNTKLDVVGNGTYAADFMSGNVGIGISSPTGGLQIATAGVASAPALNITGTWFSSGSAITTKPQLLVEQASAVTNGWSTSGTGIGVNSNSSFAGRLIDAQFDGTSKFSVGIDGSVILGSGSSGGSSLTVSGISDQLRINSYTSAGKQWRLGTAIGSSGSNRNFTIWESDLGNAFEISQSNGGVALGTSYASATGMSTVPTNGLIVSGNVGIGTSSPSQIFQVNTGSSATVITSSGNVGIGITTANSKLIVNGGAAIGSSFNVTAPSNGLLVQGNVGIGFTTPTASLSVNSQTFTTGNLVDFNTLSFNTQTSGTLLNLSSTATSLTGTAGTGSLLNLSWAPPASTTATGDLFALSIGANGTTTGNLFNILDSGSSIFSVSESSFTTSLPSNFTSSGDVGMAYDLNFTNSTASFIKSTAPLYIQSGESFNSSDLTFRTFNSGQGVFDFGGGVLLAQYQPWTLASSTMALNIQDSSNNVIMSFDTTNDRVGIGKSGPYSKFQITGAGTSTGITLQTTGSTGGFGISVLDNGNVGIGTSGPSQLFQVNTGSSATVITSTGNIGIGITTANSSLTVNGGATIGSSYNLAAPSNGLLVQGNVGIGFTTPGSKLDIYNPTSSTVDVIRVLSDVTSTGNVKFRVDSTGAIFSDAGASVGTPADVAENYAVSDKSIEAGDIVSTSPTSNADRPVVEKSTSSYQQNLLGIISTKPGLKLSSLTDGQPVALSGRVPVKVSTENGHIKVGDYLTSSTTAGVAMKASRPGPVIGKALEEFKENSEIGKIMVFVNLSFADPNNFFASLSMDSEGNLIVPKVKIGSLTLDSSLASASAQLSIVNSQLSINSDPKYTSSSPNLSSNSNSYDLSGKILSLEGIVNKQQTWIKSLEERLAALEATRSAVIVSGRESNGLSSKQSSAEIATSSSVASSSATPSANLAEASSSASSSSLLANQQTSKLDLTPPDILLATGSATLANIKVTSEATVSGMLRAYQSEIQDNFKVFGKTTLSSTTIAGDLSVDGTFSVKNGSDINVIGTLYLQNDSLSSGIDIFNGRITIDSAGNITTSGKITASEVKTNKLTIGNSATLATSIGSANLPSFTTKITIPTNMVSQNAKIFITPTTPTDKVLSVTNIKDGQSFDVSILSPSASDIKFNWWIVGTN